MVTKISEKNNDLYFLKPYDFHPGNKHKALGNIDEQTLIFHQRTIKTFPHKFTTEENNKHIIEIQVIINTLEYPSDWLMINQRIFMIITRISFVRLPSGVPGTHR